MRVYEIILSYDNGNRDYEYANGLVFEPVTDEVLGMFPAKRNQLRGYKYKSLALMISKTCCLYRPKKSAV